MTELESVKSRLVINENVVNDLITIIGYALPHTQPQLRDLLRVWNGAVLKVDAEKKATEPTPPEISK